MRYSSRHPRDRRGDCMRSMDVDECFRTTEATKATDVLVDVQPRRGIKHAYFGRTRNVAHLIALCRAAINARRLLIRVVEFTPSFRLEAYVGDDDD